MTGEHRNIPSNQKLTPNQYALLGTLRFSGERAKHQCRGLRGATWASLHDRGLITVRFNPDGEPRFRITDAGRVLYEAQQ